MPRKNYIFEKFQSTHNVNCEDSLNKTRDISKATFRTFGNSSILQRDPVTARAISRLSHGVARLTANSDPVNKSYPRYAKPNNDKTCSSEKTDTHQRSSLITGSKRRWEAEKDDPDVSMECVYSSSSNNHPTNLRLEPFCFYNPTLPRSMSSDHLYPNHSCSSASSMLSITSMSDNDTSDVSSHKHDADVEDEDNECQHEHYYKPTKGVRRKLGLDKLSSSNDLQSTLCTTGDSSDGLSVNVKIPRLSFANLSDHFTHHHHHQETSKINCKKRRSKNPVSNKGDDYLSVCKHKSHSDVESSSNGQVNLKITHKYNYGFTSSVDSSASSNELSNFQHLDSKMYKHQSSAKTKHRKTTFKKDKLYDRIPSKSSNLCDQSNTDDYSDNDLDLVFNNLLRDSWSLMSERAKSGYVDAMHFSRMKRSNRYIVPKNKSLFTAYGPVFVPPKSKWENENDATSKSKNKMPTPPWLKSDDDYIDLELNSETTISKERLCNSTKPVLGDQCTNLCVAAPLDKSNRGYVMLRKLGWEPGKPLGNDDQGLLIPIGCKAQEVDDK